MPHKNVVLKMTVPLTTKQTIYFLIYTFSYSNVLTLL